MLHAALLTDINSQNIFIVHKLGNKIRHIFFYWNTTPTYFDGINILFCRGWCGSCLTGGACTCTLDDRSARYERLRSLADLTCKLLTFFALEKSCRCFALLHNNEQSIHESVHPSEYALNADLCYHFRRNSEPASRILHFWSPFLPRSALWCSIDRDVGVPYRGCVLLVRK